MVFFFPVIDCQHDVFLVQPPAIRQLRDERAVNHVPKLLVVLQLLLQHRIEHRTTFTYGIATKLSKNIGFSGVVFGTHPLDVFHDLLGHVLVVVVKKDVGLDWPASADIHGVKARCHPLQFHVFLDKTS